MRSFRVILWTAIFGLSLAVKWGCQPLPHLTRISGDLEVEPTVIDLGPIIQQATKFTTVTLRNRGLRSIVISSVTLRAPTVSDEALDIEFSSDIPDTISPGDEQEVQIKIHPAETPLGPHQRTLIIQSADTTPPSISVPIQFEVTTCNDNNTCTQDRYDPEAQACTHEFEDGISCQPADRCIVDAICNQGVCLGRPKDCNDNDKCTQDLCNQVDGACRYEDSLGDCDDGRVCTNDQCIANTCVYSNLPLNTPCDDENSCTTDDRCVGELCLGSSILEDNVICDDNNSCTENDRCVDGQCVGANQIAEAKVGDIVFTFPLPTWTQAFLHRREVSLGNSGTFYGLYHRTLDNSAGLEHIIVTMAQCGTPGYSFTYTPPDNNVQVSFVRRAIQLTEADILRLVVGVRQLPEDGYLPHTTTYLLDESGAVVASPVIQQLGGETGRALLPDGSQVYGIIFPLTDTPPSPEQPSQQNLIIIREDLNGSILWRHDRAAGPWAEFLGVAGPRVLFWANGRFGALDFNTGSPAWTRPTEFTSDEMALSTALNLGVIRTRPSNLTMGNRGQLIGVEILEGNEVFQFPGNPDNLYFPRTEPVISADGTIGVMMQRNRLIDRPERLEWVELTEQGQVINVTPLPYVFPEELGFISTRHEDADDPFPTVADDLTVYVGYGNHFYAIRPRGGGIAWMIESTLSENAFTGAVPLLRDDGILLLNEASQQIIGIKTNGGKMSEDGWASFRHDGRRTNYTP
ncbi:MAG: hypothetical protein KTR25_12380 [Myxococcales bacterium]|nr:hypothetical protein [Myxococcales bacterium]